MPRLKNPTHEKYAQLIASKNLSQAAAYLEAFGHFHKDGKTPRKLSGTSLWTCASRLMKNAQIVARIQELRDQNEQECRMTRRELLDYYVDILEQPAGTLQPDSRLCQGIERTTTECRNAAGEITRVITKERLILPSKTEAGLALRYMMGWDKKPDSEPEDDITELLVMIRRRSGHGQLESGKPAEVKPAGHALLEAKPAELKVLSQKPETTQVLEILSRGHFEPLPLMVNPSGTE
jgi:hypothetical protein